MMMMMMIHVASAASAPQSDQALTNARDEQEQTSRTLKHALDVSAHAIDAILIRIFCQEGLQRKNRHPDEHSQTGTQPRTPKMERSGISIDNSSRNIPAAAG
jgi:hypothetical protein